MSDLQRVGSPSENLFDEVIDAIPHMVWVSDPAGATVYHNSRIQEYSGLTTTETAGDGWQRMVHADDVAEATAAWNHCIRSGETVEFEYRLRRRDGVYRWHSARALPQRDRNGNIVRWVGSCTDIDERKTAEETIKRGLDRMRAVVENMADGLVVCDAAGVLLEWNPAALRMHGFATIEEARHHLSDFTRTFTLLRSSDSPIPFHDWPLVRILRGETISDEHLLIRREDTKRELVVRISGTAIRGPSGEIELGLVTLKDITERQKLEAERDALLARLQLYVERMPLIYILFDADFRIIDWNPAAMAVFGYTKEEALGKKPADLSFPSFRQEANEFVARIRAGDMAAHSVNQNMTKDGRTITCEWFNTPLMNAAGQFNGLLCLGQDVTQRKALEEQYRQAQKMEAFGQLAGGVAHDFNNLLTVINGCSTMLLQRLPQNDPSRDLLVEIRNAGERSASLTRQLLAFSRKQLLAPRMLDLNEVVDSTASMFRRVIGENIRLSVVTGTSLWPVRADPGQVEQVLMNLVVNACDAMPTGGRLTVETANVELDDAYVRAHPDSRCGPHALLSVSDTGSGMPPEVMARIFEPFFTTKGPGKGTGLGLATVYGIVKQSEGHIDVCSVAGSGTTFMVYLPAVEMETREAPSEAELHPVPRGTETVLLAEDEKGIRDLVRLILVGYGYKVLEASDGDEAFRIAEQHAGPIHLLITDVVMPGVSGGIVAAKMVARYPQLRVLFISGYTNDIVVRHGILHEEVNFLEKPFSPTALANKVREVLDTRPRK